MGSRRPYRGRPRSSSTSATNSRCRNCCMFSRANASSVSQVGLDAATVSMVFSLTGGVSFCSGVDAPEVLDANRRLHRPHSFTHPSTLPLGPQDIGELRALINRGAEERLHAY